MAFVSNISTNQTLHVLKLFPSALADYLSELQKKGSEIQSSFLALKAGEKNERLLAQGLKAIEQCYLTTTADKAIIESHKKYIDFQLLIEGQELMETAHIQKIEIKKQYDEDRDLIVFQESSELQLLKMKAWDYAVFFPEDAHRSTLQYLSETLVRKVVVKIPIV